MSSHLWILSKLIYPEETESDLDTLDHLLIYTITTCHSKMKRRFNYHLSNRYLESLRKVKDFPFIPELQVDTDLDIFKKNV